MRQTSSSSTRPVGLFDIEAVTDSKVALLMCRTKCIHFTKMTLIMFYQQVSSLELSVVREQDGGERNRHVSVLFSTETEQACLTCEDSFCILCSVCKNGENFPGWKAGASVAYCQASFNEKMKREVEATGTSSEGSSGNHASLHSGDMGSSFIVWPSRSLRIRLRMELKVSSENLKVFLNVSSVYVSFTVSRQLFFLGKVGKIVDEFYGYRMRT